jgi:AmmeMemoRadiSam system protein B
MSTITDIRLSPLAGRWYPSDPKKLADSIDGYIQSAQIPELGGEVIALISPHAGHTYSGPVAGYAFAAIKDLQPEFVAILSPYHSYHQGTILTTAHQAYQTPLGLVPIDQDKIQYFESKLVEKTGVKLSRVRDDEEHAIEILLPFFQRSLSRPFRLLPLMIRDQDPALMRELGIILAGLINEENILLAASSDLSHFHHSEEARKLDQNIIDQIIDLNPEGLYDVQEDGTGSACGLGPLASVIWAAKETGPVKIHHLHYSHSGDITGDNNRVVGYTAAVITRE